MHAPCSSVVATTVAHTPQSHLHFSLLIASLQIKEDDRLFVRQTHSAPNSERIKEYGSLHVTEGSIFGNCAILLQDRHTHTSRCDVMGH